MALRTHLIRFAINALALSAAVWLVPGLHYTGTPAGFLALAVIFGLVNMVLRPLLTILTCPLVVLTLGLFMLVINAILLLATGAAARHAGLGFRVDGFWPALLGGIIIGLASTLLAVAIKEPGRR
jgi:putative membrane protein